MGRESSSPTVAPTMPSGRGAGEIDGALLPANEPAVWQALPGPRVSPSSPPTAVTPQSRVVEGNVGDPDACGDTGAVAAVRAWREARLWSD